MNLSQLFTRKRNCIVGYNQATKLAYHKMPQTFHATAYLNEVRKMSGTMAFDSTILRRLRALRQECPAKYSWVCIDTKQSVYQKISQN